MNAKYNGNMLATMK